MFKGIIENVRKQSPLVHNITNYVTVNDVANVILAIGASPIMSDEPMDVEDIQTICGALNINIGTLNQQSIKAMHLAGKKANELGHVLLLDPVGAGASKLRTGTAVDLLEELQFDIIRGNISEIKALVLGSSDTKGVDANVDDAVTDANLEEMVAFAKSVSKRYSAIIAITGAIDLIADENTCYVIRNGKAAMGRITGTGCQLSGLIPAFVVANKEDKLKATAAAICTMGVAGEIGYERMTDKDGNSSYRNYIIDAIYNMDDETLAKYAKCEVM